MSKLFDKVSMKAPQRNKFDLSHERKFSFNMGDIVPIMCTEVVPGDKFRVNTEIMMRLAPMLAPIMHRVNVKTEYFAVPIRLIWDEFEPFITGGKDGTATPLLPSIKLDDLNRSNFQIGTLSDYLGVPSMAAAGPALTTPFISALPFRAYQMIYNEYYRDQNLSDPIEFGLGSGEITGDEVDRICAMRKRSWEKDYFTSALPFAQRGPSVSIPIEGLGFPVYTDTTSTVPFPEDDPNFDQALAATLRKPPGALQVTYVQAGNDIAQQVQNIDNVLVNTSGANINDLRRSVRLQEWLERAARVGARYVELLKGFFNVEPDDARLQRPEYLGGGVTPVSISEVLSTVQQVDASGDPIGNPQGDMTGRGISVGNQNGFTRFFKEHCIVLGFVSVLPKTAYQQGLPKMFSRFDKFDWYWEQFANIGEQPVLNKELYLNPNVASPTPGAPTDPDGTFGYQSRYSEMKYGCSSVHGDFKTDLAYWHMGRIFSAAPELNESFVESDPTHRIFAVDDPTKHKLWCHLYHNIDAVRPMPYFGTPQL